MGATHRMLVMHQVSASVDQRQEELSAGWNGILILKIPPVFQKIKTKKKKMKKLLFLMMTLPIPFPPKGAK